MCALRICFEIVRRDVPMAADDPLCVIAGASLAWSARGRCSQLSQNDAIYLATSESSSETKYAAWFGEHRGTLQNTVSFWKMSIISSNPFKMLLLGLQGKKSGAQSALELMIRRRIESLYILARGIISEILLLIIQIIYLISLILSFGQELGPRIFQTVEI